MWEGPLALCMQPKHSPCAHSPGLLCCLQPLQHWAIPTVQSQNLLPSLLPELAGCSQTSHTSCWCSKPHLPILRPSNPQALAIFGVMLAPGWAGKAPAAVQPRGWETSAAWRRAALQSCCLLAYWPVSNALGLNISPNIYSLK